MIAACHDGLLLAAVDEVIREPAIESEARYGGFHQLPTL